MVFLCINKHRHGFMLKKTEVFWYQNRSGENVGMMQMETQEVPYFLLCVFHRKLPNSLQWPFITYNNAV